MHVVIKVQNMFELLSWLTYLNGISCLHMESVSYLLVVISLPLLIFFLILRHFQNAGKLRGRTLPGPRFELPVIGHLHLLGLKPHLTFQKWKKRYGPLYTFKMASETTFVVNDLKLMKEILSLSVASGRPSSVFWKAYSGGRYGILMSDGRVWEEQRAFAIKILSELGLSKNGTLEGIIVDEAQNFLKYFKKNVGVPITATRIFNGAVVSSLWTIVSGEKVEWMVDGDVKETEITTLALDLAMDMNKGIKTGFAVLPWLRYLPGLRSIWTRYISNIQKFPQRVGSTIEKHEESVDTFAPRDFIDYYLLRNKTTSNPSSSFYKDTGKRNMITIVGDLYLAGSVTMSTTLEYGLMYLGSSPEKQDKLYKELSTVLGSRCPTLSDRDSLPYTQAVILEIFRRSAAVSLTVHRMLEDCEFHGHLFPKDSLVMGDFYSVLRDSEIWGEDEATFRPERHLNKDETEVVHHEALIPFGVGRRACIGEQLGMDTVFLFLASIFQKFRVEVEEGSIDFDNVEPGLSLEPYPFEIIVHSRNNDGG